MDSKTKAILKVASASDADIEKAEAKADELLKAFLAVGKRASFGFNQAANARVILDAVSGSEWSKMTAVEKAVVLHRHSNASAMRQYAEKKGWLVVSKDAVDY